MADDLADAILNSNDIETVREGIPAYLLLMDGLLNSSPDNVDLLFAAARLNSSYSIYTDVARAKLLNQKSFDLAMRAVCLSRSVLCDSHSVKFEDFSEVVERLEKHKPSTLGQASRLEGVTPAAINLIAITIKKSELLVKAK